jgi:hypothetical protein
MCNAQDVDTFAFTMPANHGGAALIRFVQAEGNLALDLLDDSGAVLATSNVSSTQSPLEQVDVPGRAVDTTFFLRARPATANTTISLGQRYSVEVHTFDAAQCVASEPAGGDDTFGSGLCVGAAGAYASSAFPCSAFVAEPLVAHDGLTCGNSDSDVYRAGVLDNDQAMHAHLVFDHAQGILKLDRLTVTPPSTTPVVTSVTDGDNDGVIDIFFVQTANGPRDVAVAVKATGTTGHVLQPYTLTLEVGAQCFEDFGEPNEKPSTAIAVDRASLPATIDGRRCNNDVDVYAIPALAGDTVTVGLTAADSTPGFLVAELGTAPADLDNAAIPVALTRAGNVPLQFLVDEDQTLYVTVKAGANTNDTGPYTLSVNAAP